MSTKVSNWVWEHSTARGSALVVMLRLADMANDDGWCYPGKMHLAKKCRLNPRNLHLTLRRLEASGELVIRQRRRDANRNDTNLYRVVIAGGGRSTDHPVGDLQITQVDDLQITQWVIYRSPDPSLETKTINRQQNKVKKPPLEIERKTILEEDNSASSVFADDPADDQKQGQEPGKKQSTRSAARRAATKSTLSAAHEPRDLRRYAEPLTDAEDEALAMRLLTAATDLSRENARMLVDVYGLSAVWDALNLFYATGGVVRRPGAWIRKLLQRNLQTEWQELSSL